MIGGDCYEIHTFLAAGGGCGDVLSSTHWYPRIDEALAAAAGSKESQEASYNKKDGLETLPKQQLNTVYRSSLTGNTRENFDEHCSWGSPKGDNDVPLVLRH